jgi:hypothetical protein
MILLVDKPDYLNFIGAADGSAPVCSKANQYCGSKAALSALDGFLVAEEEAKISGSPKLAVSWSMATTNSMDGTVAGEGVSSFRDMESSVKDPKLVEYDKELVTKKSVLQKAFTDRWVHAVDTQSPWTYLVDKIVGPYKQFGPRPWFIANFDYQVPEGKHLADDLATMDSMAALENNPFMGVVFSQFQRDYVLKTGVQGMFGLGSEQIGENSVAPCWIDVLTAVETCASFRVDCLSEKAGDPGRADAVRSAWNGYARSQGMCNNTATRTQHVLV